jgi:hypothetical protein
VLKERIKLAPVPSLDELRYMTDLETQTVAAAFAFEFNESARPKFKVKFLKVKAVKFPTRDGLGRWMNFEMHFRDGKEFVKYNNNWKWTMRVPTDGSVTGEGVCDALLLFRPPKFTWDMLCLFPVLYRSFGESSMQDRHGNRVFAFQLRGL